MYPVAWRVSIDDMSCVVFAFSKRKAQWLATKSYWDAFGRKRGVWPRASAARAPTYDESPLRSCPPKAYAEEYVGSLS